MRHGSALCQAGAVTLSDLVARHARELPDASAFVTPDDRMTWREYDSWATRLSGTLLALGLAQGDRVAVMLPDGPAVHAAFVAVERAGLVIVGIGPRAGDREIEHLITRSGARGWITGADHASLAARLGCTFLTPDAAPDAAVGSARRSPPTRSGCSTPRRAPRGCRSASMHDQRRWFAFHDLAVAAADLTPRDVFMSALPAPFGFGIWTAHVTPTVLGAPTVVMPRFDADESRWRSCTASASRCWPRCRRSS